MFLRLMLVGPAVTSRYVRYRYTQSQSASLQKVLVSCIFWCQVLGLASCNPAMPVDGSACTAVVPFSNTNPWVDSFRLKTRNFVIGGTPFVINQAWYPNSFFPLSSLPHVFSRPILTSSMPIRDDRTEEDPEPTGMKWTGAAVWDAAVVLSDFLCTRKSLIEVWFLLS